MDRFYRSARSLYAQGDELAALKMVEAALASGEKAGDQDSLLRTKALFEEIKKQVEDSKPKSSEVRSRKKMSAQPGCISSRSPKVALDGRMRIMRSR